MAAWYPETRSNVNITNSWFGQRTDGIRYHSAGQVTLISNSCFADLETGIKLAHPVMSSLHDNAFAYVSKCFEIERISHSSINNNVLFNWRRSTGAAAFGAFFHIARSEKLNMTANTIRQEIDAAKRTAPWMQVPTAARSSTSRMPPGSRRFRR